jgi:hypothetical protein
MIPRSPVRETRNPRLTNMNSKTDPKTTTTNPKTVGAAMTEAVVTGTMVGIAMGAAMGAVGAAVTAGMIGAKRPGTGTETTTETPPEDVTETVTRIEPIANALDVAAGHGMGMATETELQDEMNRHVSDLCKALRIDPATIAGIPETTTDRPAGLIKRITTGIKRFF